MYRAWHELVILRQRQFARSLDGAAQSNARADLGSAGSR